MSIGVSLNIKSASIESFLKQRLDLWLRGLGGVNLECFSKVVPDSCAVADSRGVTVELRNELHDPVDDLSVHMIMIHFSSDCLYSLGQPARTLNVAMSECGSTFWLCSADKCIAAQAYSRWLRDRRSGHNRTKVQRLQGTGGWQSL